MKIFKVLVLGLVAFPIILQAKPKKQKKMAFPFGTWMRSQEEDKDPNAAWLLYRPDGYNFPPARGRSGFILQKDGKFALIGPSPSDLRDTLWGTWTALSPGRMKISVKESAFREIQWKRVSGPALLISLKE